jgi:dethiobiotin synthetase
MQPSHKTIAIAGIDTDVGKTVVAGLFARYLLDQQYSVTTCKLVQTGCKNISEDILLHRKLMGVPLFEYDKDSTSCPYVFTTPASPHLAAKLEQKIIDPGALTRSISTLQKSHDFLLVEGAGGLMVPLTNDLILIDFFAQMEFPLVLVCSSKLGSINHTRLSLEAIKNRGIELLGIVYNLHQPSRPEIVQDSLQQCRKAVSDYELEAPVLILPDINESRATNWNQLVNNLV